MSKKRLCNFKKSITILNAYGIFLAKRIKRAKSNQKKAKMPTLILHSFGYASSFPIIFF